MIGLPSGLKVNFANPSKFITTSDETHTYIWGGGMQKVSLRTMMALHICKEIEPGLNTELKTPKEKEGMRGKIYLCKF